MSHTAHAVAHVDGVLHMLLADSNLPFGFLIQVGLPQKTLQFWSTIEL